ncbi:unnamed protein product [Kuraishia capsulata CBS 1993]|uniref:Uncharacterized protein n=1 Tax=Kuraishia capsulata CBS 1993 TaxID=1382522 RepID=W6MTN1_9ASCO|nr:uncharacterized protein KUCA_T00004540001 [Kuraishia capsulata CBS 1993]CDK28557.1 unnamed protein product [Kuraishia capsulata CBS 1993]
MYVRAATRKQFTNSIFSTTFVVAFGLVLSNSLLPCPVDHSMNNDSPAFIKVENNKDLEKPEKVQ